MSTPTEETITKALDNLEIDAEPISATTAILEDTAANAGEATTDPAQQYMGSYPQMHHHMMGMPHMPPPHMMGYPPHSQYIMMDAANSGDMSGNNAGLRSTDFSSFNPYPMIHPNGGSGVGTSADNFWTSSQPTDAAAAVNDINYIRGASFAATSSGPLEDAVVGEDSTIDQSLGQSKSRRQTFAAGTTTDLLNPPHAVVGSTSRTQSISLDVPSGGIFATNTNTSEVDPVAAAAKATGENVAQGFQNSSFPPAYPYNGPLLQPNPIYNGHPMNASPFQPYGFPSFQSFSPIPANGQTNSGENKEGMNSAAGPAHFMPGEDYSVLPPHIDSPANVPWMYGSPSPFPGSQSSVMMQNNANMKHGGLYNNGSKQHRQKNGKKGNAHGNYGNNNSSNNNNNNGGGNRNHFYPKNKMDGRYNMPADGVYNKNFKQDHYNIISAASAKYANATLTDFVGTIYSLCRDQHGCRFLQKQLDMGGFEAAALVFFEIKEHIVELMVDSFGNYLVQKLLEVSSEEQKLELVTIAAPEFLKISLDPHGTRALQKLVECISTLEEVRIIQESLKGHVVELSKDLNGNHVIQKLLTKLKTEDAQFIFEECCEATVEISTQRHGCCVLQRCLDNGSLEQRTQLCEKIMENIDMLSVDPYGNYVIQYILTKEAEYGENKFTEEIVELLKHQVVKLSLHKFGSNVVENILRTPSVSYKIVTELVNSGEENISKLLNDSYGNYVLQTSLDSVKDYEKKELFNKLSAIVKPLLVGPIRSSPHGRRMIAIIEGTPVPGNGNGHRGGKARHQNRENLN